MKSRKTLTKRIKALKRAKAISLVVEHQGWKAPISTWELLKTRPGCGHREMRALHAAARGGDRDACGPRHPPQAARSDPGRGRIDDRLARVRREAAALTTATIPRPARPTMPPGGSNNREDEGDEGFNRKEAENAYPSYLCLPFPTPRNQGDYGD